MAVAEAPGGPGFGWSVCAAVSPRHSRTRSSVHKEACVARTGTPAQRGKMRKATTPRPAPRGRRNNPAAGKRAARGGPREGRVRTTCWLPPTKLAEAKRMLGTRTDVETVETALDLVVFREEVRQDGQVLGGRRLSRLGEAGADARRGRPRRAQVVRPRYGDFPHLFWDLDPAAPVDPSQPVVAARLLTKGRTADIRRFYTLTDIAALLPELPLEPPAHAFGAAVVRADRARGPIDTLHAVAPVREPER